MLTAKDLKISEWKVRTNKYLTYKEYELKIEGRNIIIGFAYQTYEGNLRVGSRVSNIAGDYVDIPLTEDIEVIHQTWEECMNKLLQKLFK